MKKSYTVYMIINNEEIRLHNCKTREQAELKIAVEMKRDAAERKAGYHVPAADYIIK